MLRAALLLLTCGFCRRMRSINTSITYTLTSLTGLGVAFCLVVVIVGTPSCVPVPNAGILRSSQLMEEGPVGYSLLHCSLQGSALLDPPDVKPSSISADDDSTRERTCPTTRTVEEAKGRIFPSIIENWLMWSSGIGKVKQSQIFSLPGPREVIPFTRARYLASAQSTSLTSPAGYHSPQGCGVLLYALSNPSVIRGSGGG